MPGLSARWMVQCALHQLRERGGLRSSPTDRGAQVLPPAGGTVPPWLPAKSARVSNLPACCALGPPACAAPCSCRREPCTGRSAWPHLGRACLSAWIEHRSRSNQGLKARPRAQLSARPIVGISSQVRSPLCRPVSPCAAELRTLSTRRCAVYGPARGVAGYSRGGSLAAE
jgi:hypothetical protein